MLRRGIICVAAQAYTEALLNPDLPSAEGERLVTIADELDKAIEKIIRIVTNSSSPAYAESDLPGDEKTDLKKYRHALRMLRSLYGPQEA